MFDNSATRSAIPFKAKAKHSSKGILCDGIVSGRAQDFAQWQCDQNCNDRCCGKVKMELSWSLAGRLLRKESPYVII